jgi:hypothetical protein
MDNRLMPLKLNSSGGGSVTLDVPATATATSLIIPSNAGTVVTTGSTGVVTQTMLAAGVAGNGPAFSAYLGSNQTINNNVNTKLMINIESFDTNNRYDTSLYRFTPNVAGYYFVAGRVQISNAQYAIPNIYKNGIVVKSGVQGEPTNAPYGTTVSGLIYLNGSTDFIELYAYQFNSGGASLTAAAAEHACFFDAFMARAA